MHIYTLYPNALQESRLYLICFCLVASALQLRFAAEIGTQSIVIIHHTIHPSWQARLRNTSTTGLLWEGN